jgi:hypothetical protein
MEAKLFSVGNISREESSMFSEQFGMVDEKDSEESFTIPTSYEFVTVTTEGLSSLEVKDLAKRMAKEAITSGCTHVTSNNSDQRFNFWLAMYVRSGNPDYWTGESVEYGEKKIPFIFYMRGRWHELF